MFCSYAYALVIGFNNVNLVWLWSDVLCNYVYKTYTAVPKFRTGYTYGRVQKG